MLDEMTTDAGAAVMVRLSRVLEQLPAIPKNGQAPGNMGGYAFRRVEDILAALKPLLATNGLVILPTVIDRIEAERPTRSGGVMFCVDLQVAFRFVGQDGDSVVATVWGQGTDAGDKATQKAMTSALKTMLSVVFCISDTDLDAEGHEVPETTRRPRTEEPPDGYVRERDGAMWSRGQHAWIYPTADPETGEIGQAAGEGAPGPSTSPDGRSGQMDQPPRQEPGAADSGREQPPLERTVVLPPLEPADQVRAEVAAMSPVAVVQALEAAGLSTGGNPKMLKARLLESRLAEVPF